MLRYSLVLFLYAVGTLAGLSSFAMASCLYLWSNIFRPLEFSRHPGALPVAHFVLVLLVLSYVINWGRGKVIPRLSWMIPASIPFLLWMIVCATLSPFQAMAWETFVKGIKYILPLLLLSTGLSRRTDIKYVAAILMLSVGVWSSQSGVHGILKGVTPKMAIPGGQMSDNNDFTAAAVSILPILIYFFFTYRYKFKLYVKAAAGAITVLTLGAVVFSNSRGAAVGVAGMLLFYVVWVSRKKVRDAILLAVIGAIGIFVLAPDTFISRMKTIELSGEQTDESAQNRMHLMQSAFRASMDHPVFGLGPGCWIMVSEEYAGDRHEPHDTYIKLAAELGYPGLFLWLIIMVGTVARLLRFAGGANRRGHLEDSALARTLACCVVGLLIPYIFLSQPLSEFLWAWVALGNAFLVVVSSESAPEDVASEDDQPASQYIEEGDPFDPHPTDGQVD